MRGELSGSTLSRFWIADPLAILAESDVIREVSAENIIPFFVGDNVHLTAPGYSKLVDGITDCFKRAVGSGISAAVNVPGVPVPASCFSWRGFSSPNGSARPKNTVRHYKSTGGQDRSKWGRRHPYRGR